MTLPMIKDTIIGSTLKGDQVVSMESGINGNEKEIVSTKESVSSKSLFLQKILYC